MDDDTAMDKDTDTGIGQKDVNPFARRTSVQRTPPRSRASSISNMAEGIDRDALAVEQVSKRKRLDRPPEDDRNDADIRGNAFKAIIKGLLMDIKRLDTVVKDMYKPKQEVKEAASRLALHAAKLQSKDLTNWLQQAADSTTAEEMGQTQRNEKQIGKAEQLIAQCEECKIATRKAARRKILLVERTFENFQKVTEDDWESEILPKHAVGRGRIWEVPAGHEIILPCSKNFSSGNKQVS